MQNFFVAVHSDGETSYLKTQSIDRETLLNTLPETLGCQRDAIKKAVWLGSHEYEKFPANIIKTSAGLFKLVIDKTDGKHGAPMGRANVFDCPIVTSQNGEEYLNPGKTFDRRVELDGGGYDAGGAYWGRGTELRVTYNEDLTFVRFYRR